MISLPTCSRWCAALALLLWAGTAVASHVFDFGTASELGQGFTVGSVGGQEGGGYVWSNAAGAGGAAGRVEILPTTGHGIEVLFSTFAFDLNASAVQASFLFQGGATAGISVPRIGLLLHTENEAAALGGVALTTMWVQDSSGRQPARLAAFDKEQTGLTALAGGNWYGLSTRWELDKSAEVILVTSELWEHGAEGGEPLSRIAQVQTRITDSALFGNGGVVSPLYLGFFAQNGIGGAVALDRLSFSGEIVGAFVPEPALGSVLLGMGLALLICRRRRLVSR